MLKLIPAIDMNFDSVVDYYNSFDKKQRDEINSFTIRSVEDGKDKYFALVTYSYENIYYLIDDSNINYIIGFGSIENSGLKDYHLPLNNDGNISYGIRPNERNKGYGTKLLKLLLEKCEELEMDEVCVSCLKENIISKKVIENNGGILECECIDNWTRKQALKYWIKLNPKRIRKHK